VGSRVQCEIKSSGGLILIVGDDVTSPASKLLLRRFLRSIQENELLFAGLANEGHGASGEEREQFFITDKPYLCSRCGRRSHWWNARCSCLRVRGRPIQNPPRSNNAGEDDCKGGESNRTLMLLLSSMVARSTE
jgi:hypothetical protein